MIEKLRLRGSIGIKRGLELDDIEVDFTGRAGLIALDGANGRGKTSMLDNLQMFDCLPSRDGALKNHFALRDSLKELTFTHDGHHYLTRIKIDAISGKSEGFVFVDGSDKSETKGSISEYHKYVASRFGSPELFFSSIFCAQGAKKISDMTVGTLKGLFVEFLRLERYEAWADAAKQAGNVLSGQVGQVESRIAILSEMTKKKEDFSIQLRASEQDAIDNNSLKETLRQKLAEKRQQIDTLKETIQKNALALQRKVDLQQQIERLEAELAREKEAATAEIGGLTAKWTELSEAVLACNAVLRDREKIEQAADMVREMEDTLPALQAEIDECEKDRSEGQMVAHNIEKEIDAYKQQLKDLDSDPENTRMGNLIEDAERYVKEKTIALDNLLRDAQYAKLTAEVAALEKAALVGAGIDATCASVTCAAIKSVNEAKAHLPAAIEAREKTLLEISEARNNIEKEIHAKKDETETVLDEKSRRVSWIAGQKKTIDEQLQSLTHNLRNKQQVVIGNAELITLKRQQLAANRAGIAKQKTLTDKLSEIQVAEQRKADLEKQLQEVTEAGTAKKEAWDRKELEHKVTVQQYHEAINEINIDETAELSLSQTQKAIVEIETVKLPAIEKDIQAAREKIATLQAELSKIEAAETELQEAKANRDALSLKISRWRYLQDACGKNGLQALEIDGAAPLISEQANRLLHLGYGPQFSIRIDTQDENGREDLDIKVISEDGEDSLKMKSGGETVWLLHPIRLAMTLLSKEKSGRNWDYAAFDEITGALDSKGASTNFMAMYEPFMEIGQFRQIFFISHQDECLAFADHVLRFERGRNPWWG